jgi:predicted ATPase
MIIDAIKIKNFKRIVDTTVPLEKITVIVGGNNSGKSCVLQAPHFAVNLLQATVLESATIIPAHNLRYMPTSDILDLPHGKRLTAETEAVSVEFWTRSADAEESATRPQQVNLTRGEGLNIQIGAACDEHVESVLSDYSKPFSIYVPGLAGIPLVEEFRSAAVIDGAIARGDANLYLRNVLLRISEDADKLNRMNGYLSKILSEAELVVKFDVATDAHIRAWIKQRDRETPIDSMGTGILQCLQILAYAIQYEPSLILLDEPDAHLHPNNQRTVANLLRDLVEKSGTQVILATHSRTLLDAFRNKPDSSFVWLENGFVQKAASQEHISMLMALGALDGGERFYTEECSAVVLTEDTELEFLEVLLESNGIDPDATLIHSYQSSSRFDAAIELAKFIKMLKPGVQVIIHRDRDFMCDDAVREIENIYRTKAADVNLFVTSGSDIEHYFTSPEHLAARLGGSQKDAEKLIADVIDSHKAELCVKYNFKFEDLKILYRKWGGEPKKSTSAAKGQNFGREHALGKLLLRKILDALSGEVHNAKALLLTPSETLIDADLKAISEKIPELGGPAANA